MDANSDTDSELDFGMMGRHRQQLREARRPPTAHRLRARWGRHYPFDGVARV